MLDFHLTPLVRAREHRVGREVRERVTRVSRDHLAHEATAEEQRTEARQREHDQRELRIAAPPLAHDLTRRRRPARVADHRMQHVAGANVGGNRVGERASFVVHTGNVVIQVILNDVSRP